MMYREVGGYRVFRVRTLEGQPVDVLPVGLKELCERYGKGRGAVHNWTTRYDDFPEPITTACGHPVYDGYAVDRWVAENRSRIRTDVRPFPTDSE